MRRTACSGRQEISKAAFLNMIGDPRPPSPAPVRGVEAAERVRTLIALDYCDGNKARAAAILGITTETLGRRLSIRTSPANPFQTSPSRRFFESVKGEWSIGGLDTETLEVCARIDLPHGTNFVSSLVKRPI